jgi:signal transduction histidine kinase
MAEAGEPSLQPGLVHDLRSPLAIIDGFAALIERDGELSDEQRKDYAGRIRDAAAEMRALLDAL